MTNADIPSRFSVMGAYEHYAEIRCWSCDGAGTVQGYVCGICLRKGTFTVGCGGRGELDDKHTALGGWCEQCGNKPYEEFRLRPPERYSLYEAFWQAAKRFWQRVRGA